jgi:hypothetical protein
MLSTGVVVALPTESGDPAAAETAVTVPPEFVSASAAGDHDVPFHFST